MKRKEELRKIIEGISITYDYEETYSNLYNSVIDYMNDTQDFSLEYLFEDIISYEFAEEQARYELEKGGLVRLYYFLGNANLNNSIFRIDGYGNLQDFTIEDLRTLKSEILSNLE